MEKHKIGFFGGTFDPIHLGHLNMAKALMVAKNLDEVWFCPAYTNPFKPRYQSAPIKDRLAMVKLALNNHSSFHLLDIEAKRAGPSYTVDTLRQLVATEKRRPKPREIFLVISDELAPEIFRWHEAQEIIKLATLLVGSREGSSKTPPDFEGDPQICQAISAGWTPTPVKAISSTEIRQRLRDGQSCEGLVPDKVLDYIVNNNLYRIA